MSGRPEVCFNCCGQRYVREESDFMPPRLISCPRCGGTGIWYEPEVDTSSEDAQLKKLKEENLHRLRSFALRLEALIIETNPIVSRLGNGCEGLEYARGMLAVQLELSQANLSLQAIIDHLEQT